MKKIRFIGDVHGNIRNLQCLSDELINIQLGDLNLFGYDVWFDKTGTGYVKTPFEFEFPCWFVDGNHDNFALKQLNPDSPSIVPIEKNLFYIPRGYVSGKTLFIGGADSIDRNVRTFGVDWFQEEQFTSAQINRIMDLKDEIEVVVSHDAPVSFVKHKLGTVYNLMSGKFLDAVFGLFKPSLWVFGHFHQYFNEEFNGCRFVGLGEKQSADIEIPLGDDFGKDQ